MYAWRDNPTQARHGELAGLAGVGQTSLVAMWLFPTDTSKEQTLIYCGRTFRVRIRSGKLSVDVGSQETQVTTRVTASEWHHVAIRMTGIDRASVDPDERGEEGGLARVIADANKEDAIVRYEVFTDFVMRDEGFAALEHLFLRKSVQFLGESSLAQKDPNDKAEDIRPDDGILHPFGGFVSEVEVWDDARELFVEQLAFGRFRSGVPAMRFAPIRVDEEGMARGLDNVGARQQAGSGGDGRALGG